MQLAKHYGFDRATLFVLIGRGCAILSRPITLALIVMKMTPGTQARVLNMHTLKPLDEDAIFRAA